MAETSLIKTEAKIGMVADMVAYDYQLLLKCLLEHGVAWAPDQEILLRDPVRLIWQEPRRSGRDGRGF